VERPVVADEFTPLHPGSDRADHPVIVELLGSHGQVRHRTRLTALPAVIGRGYDCDVILDDPHVCARHAELARDDAGVLVLRDLASVNGIGPRGADVRAERVRLSSGDRVRVGPVEIRIVEAAHPVAPAVPLASERRLTTGITRPGRALAVCAGALLASMLLNYQASIESDAFVAAIRDAVWVLAGVAFWASAWALATRIVSRGFRFLQHWAWAIGIMLIGLVLTTVGEWIDFLGPSLEAGSWVTAIGGLALLPILIAGHLEIASSMSQRRRWRAALSVGTIVIGLTLITSLGTEEPTWSIDFSGTLKPLPTNLIRGVSLDQFMESTESLKAEVDALAEEDAPDDTDQDAPADTTAN
jgi:hypothetical protein